MRKNIFVFWNKLSRALSGRGVGKIPGVRRSYRFISNLFRPKGFVLIECQGSRMYVDGRDAAITPYLLTDGVYEPFETEVFKQTLKQGDVVLDIGAHIGYYTLIAAKAIGKDGKVFAFEPSCDNYSLLAKNVRINGYQNVVLEEKAASDRTGKLRLYINRDNTAMHRVYESEYSSVYVEVDAIRLDEYFQDRDCKIDLIKIDVEGAEMSVFRGMPQLLEKNRKLKVFTEFAPCSIREFGVEPQEYIKFFIDRDFRPYYLNEEKEKIEPVSVPELLRLFPPENRRFTNLLLVRE